MGWALKNLSESDRADIARSLFSAEERVDKKGWLNGLCPFHEDVSPSFGYNCKEDVFHCLAGCTKDGDLIDLYCRASHLDSKTGFKEFKEKFGVPHFDRPVPQKKITVSKLKKKTGPPVDLKQMRHAYNELFVPLPEKWCERLKSIRGWSREAISTAGLKLQTHYRDKQTGELKPVRNGYGRIAMPVYDGKGLLCNIRLYDPDNQKLKILSWASGTGGSRLFPADLQGDGLVILAEGEPDTLCAMSMGFTAITQTSKTISWKKSHLALFKGRDVVIAYDADEAGVKYGHAAAKNLAPEANSVRIINWPDFMMAPDGGLPKKKGQDLTDFFKQHGKTAGDFEALIATAKVVEKTERKPAEVESVYQFFEVGGNGRLTFKPRLLADRILQDIPLLYDPTTKLMYRWSGKYWKRYELDQIRNKVIHYLGTEYSKGRVEDTVYAVQHLSTLPDGKKVNGQHDMICINNGMFRFDGEKFEVLPHDRKYYATVMVEVDFDPENPADCDLWIDHLSKTIQTPEAIKQLQEFFGYCLTRETRYGKCLIMLGPGSDGKSKVLEILRLMVGPENCASIGFKGLEDPFQRSSLYNKLVNLSAEISADAMDSEYFKKIVTGDTINASFKHKDFFDFDPYCKLIFAVNKLPRVLDNSDGFFRRLLPIKFKRQFVEGIDADEFMGDKLAREVNGIFAWAVVGLIRLREQGSFTKCAETAELLADYRRLNNPVFCFIEDECTISGDARGSKDRIYSQYRSYCSTNGYQPSHLENFWREARLVVKNLQNYRPTRNGKRESWVKGIDLAIPESLI